MHTPHESHAGAHPAKPDLDDARPSARGRSSTTAVLAAVARRRGYRLLFVGLTLAGTALYTLVLPGLHTMQVGPSNWGRLTVNDVVFALLLGAGLASVLTLQVYALRQAAGHRASRGAAVLAATAWWSARRIADRVGDDECCAP
ncbi:MAG: hypothetical protein QJR12_03520 [Mycobacterium sp.]|uniref:hypothetical protein n=1 Tax=Mycobacterium sp. TaxID=1785 RepID=UPI00261C31E3|nr:hypothetical protein [Mycobacterium sp.]MDI3313374.1 hypothetical protein [Mycobacterium sp.]